MKEMYSEMDRAELHSSDPSYLKSQLLQTAEVPCLSSSSLLPNFMYPSMGLCHTRESVQTPTSPCTCLCSAQALQQPIRAPETKPGGSRSPHRDSRQQTLACNTVHPGHLLSLAQSTAPRESKYRTCSASSHKINVRNSEYDKTVGTGESVNCVGEVDNFPQLKSVIFSSSPSALFGGGCRLSCWEMAVS